MTPEERERFDAFRLLAKACRLWLVQQNELAMLTHFLAAERRAEEMDEECNERIAALRLKPEEREEKEMLAEALREFPTWGHAYIATKRRAEAAERRAEEAEKALQVTRGLANRLEGELDRWEAVAADEKALADELGEALSQIAQAPWKNATSVGEMARTALAKLEARSE